MQASQSKARLRAWRIVDASPLSPDGGKGYGGMGGVYGGSMLTLKSYFKGEWREGVGEGAVLRNPATEEVVAQAGTEGLDLVGALAYAREKGGPALRAMTFAERGAMLKAMSKALVEV